MAEKRKVVLTKLAAGHIHDIYTSLIDAGFITEAGELMDDFLDVVFGEIPRYADKFPICEGVKPQNGDYRMGHIVGDFRVIFQIYMDKVQILMILHESDLPF
ncbi:MAG: hypothetical protein AAFR61_10290 [Bacteroidota bacterium]